jgi:SOS-response transcriptional repressor LexA
MSRKALAAITGLSENAISKIISGETEGPTPSNLEATAKALGFIKATPLKDRRTEPREDIPLRELPLISLVQAGQFTEYTDQEYPAGWSDEFLWSTEKGRHVSALRITGESMKPVFNEGDIVVVNPDKEVVSGNFAVVKLLKSGETTIKRVEFYDELIILRPVNDAYKPITIKAEDKENRIRIVGKVVETIRRHE